MQCRYISASWRIGNLYTAEAKQEHMPRYVERKGSEYLSLYGISKNQTKRVWTYMKDILDFIQNKMYMSL